MCVAWFLTIAVQSVYNVGGVNCFLNLEMGTKIFYKGSIHGNFIASSLLSTALCKYCSESKPLPKCVPWF